MFFEDEKDIIENGADIHISEDGTVTWEDVLSDTDDSEELVSIKDNNSNKKESDKNLIDLGDELELVSDDEEEIDDKELAQILNKDEDPKKGAFDAFGSAKTIKETGDIIEEQDFDIDEKLASAVSEQNKKSVEETEEIIMPKAMNTKKNSSSTVFLLAILVAVMVVAGVYYLIGFTKDNGLNESALKAPKSVQEDMNNITQEDLANRNETQPVQAEAIPIVNEDEANAIKPDNQAVEQKKEKKEVIAIVPTGRPNPFVPLKKYTTVKVPDVTVVDYDKAGLPKPPEGYGEPDEQTRKMLTISVSGIMYDKYKPSAIITYDNNDYFVQKGDKLDGYKVIDIARDHVTVALGKNCYRAKVGEEFKITSDFYGSAQYLPQKQGGGRQYYSVTAEDKVTNTNEQRYTSEEDVEIKTR